MLAGLDYSRKKSGAPAFWRATVNVETPGDTFLDMRPWGKGVAWLNGHCLGRFWNIGPQQTMYVPGPWLKAGRNEIVILDWLGPEKPLVAAPAQPVMDRRRAELDFARVRRPEVKLTLDTAKPLHSGQFAPGAALQEITFAQPAK